MSNDDAENASRWYAIHAHPKQEDRANLNLRAWNVETFHPKIKERRYNQYSGKAICSVKPLFPRYLFARFNAELLLRKVWFTRGVQCVVGFGGHVQPIDDRVISIIKSRVGDDGLVRMAEELEAGDEVVINDGPFKNFRGIFERQMKETDRVMILLTTINYQSHILIDREMIVKVDGRHRVSG
jgi:transcription elongation factor/antiterminator RfaH